MTKPFITIDEIVKNYGIPRTRIEKDLRNGTIPNKKYGKYRYILRHKFDEWYLTFMGGIDENN